MENVFEHNELLQQRNQNLYKLIQKKNKTIAQVIKRIDRALDKLAAAQLEIEVFSIGHELK